MKLFKLLSIIFCSVFLFSCSTENNDSEKIKELEVRLIATESQLLNIKSELAQCSDHQDSVNIKDSRSSVDTSDNN